MKNLKPVSYNPIPYFFSSKKLQASVPQGNSCRKQTFFSLVQETEASKKTSFLSGQVPEDSKKTSFLSFRYHELTRKISFLSVRGNEFMEKMSFLRLLIHESARKVHVNLACQSALPQQFFAAKLYYTKIIKENINQINY